jgi:hypothetical protein
MPTPSRHQVAYPDLYATMTAQQRASVDAALASDRLENGPAPRELVELVVRSTTESMSDSDYVDAVMAAVGDTPR